MNPSPSPCDAALQGLPLPVDSLAYVSRSLAADRPEPAWTESLSQPGALVRIRGPWKLGKTTLIRRQLHWARQQGYRIAYGDLAAFDAALLEDLDGFLQAFCTRVAEALHCPPRLEDFWDDLFGSAISCKGYFEEYLLPADGAPLLLALDNVHRLFAYPQLADEFFGLLRAWHEEAKTRPLWQRLRLVVAHAPEIYIPSNINKSPFNVGALLDLQPLLLEEFQRLAQGYGLRAEEPTGMAALWAWVGGQPYLCQLALQGLATSGGAIAPGAEPPTGPWGIGPDSLFWDHLQWLQQALSRQPSLIAPLQQVLAGEEDPPLDSHQVARLQSLGAVIQMGPTVQISCPLYGQYFAQAFASDLAMG